MTNLLPAQTLESWAEGSSLIQYVCPDSDLAAVNMWLATEWDLDNKVFLVPEPWSGPNKPREAHRGMWNALYLRMQKTGCSVSCSCFPVSIQCNRSESSKGTSLSYDQSVIACNLANFSRRMMFFKVSLIRLCSRGPAVHSWVCWTFPGVSGASVVVSIALHLKPVFWWYNKLLEYGQNQVMAQHSCFPTEDFGLNRISYC